MKSVCAFLALAASSPALAEPASAPTMSASIERHHTSNALDSEFAVADWYTLIRGSLQHAAQHENGVVRLGAEFQASRYDTIGIEDDHAAALQLEVTKKLSPTVELRGALSYRVSSEGDDLTLGPFVLGTRTLSQVFAAETQLGIDLGGGTALVLELADALEKVGRTTFQDTIFAPTKLDPDQNRLRIGARLFRTAGPVTYGVSASATRVSVEKLGFPPAGLSLSEYTLRTEAGWTGTDGATINVALGIQTLLGADDIYANTRPTYQLSFAKPLLHGLELRGAVFGRFETVDSDDPLASWLQRGEIEVRLRPSEKLLLASGIFGELKENLLLENEEHAYGIYAEAAYDATKALSLVVRLDFTDRRLTVIDTRKNSLDAFVGIRTKL
ncbi:hypothetical protein [Pseudaminobacter sp. NGMCC 1.201702]|uniref:hypothetical protein n=1 Tax=Pseudaminobacter sp. NGMCC 1.201702 TaxID=3391825 RepID=UPI0039EF531B